MKKLSIIIMLLLVTSTAMARDKVNLQLDLGGFGPKEDKVFSKYYEPGFFIGGSISYELDNGWEIKGKLGSYQDQSHQPVTPNLYNEKLYITPLTFSAIYHFNNKSSFHPYIGGGLGFYWWSTENDLYSELESGTKFGSHALAGFKWNINEGFYINMQYEKHFLDKFWLNYAENANMDSYTLGIGFSLPVIENSNKTNYRKTTSTYKYSEKEEKLLVKINEQERKIKNLEYDREDIEYELDSLYDTRKEYGTNEYRAIQDKISNLENKLRRIDRQIRREEDKLEVLKEKWERIARDRTPVREHIKYLHHHHTLSPYGLRYRDGGFWYDSNSNTNTTVIYNTSTESTQTEQERLEERKNYLDNKSDFINQIKNRR